jgi:hypothetical protein
MYIGDLRTYSLSCAMSHATSRLSRIFGGGSPSVTDHDDPRHRSWVFIHSGGRAHHCCAIRGKFDWILAGASAINDNKDHHQRDGRGGPATIVQSLVVHGFDGD